MGSEKSSDPKTSWWFGNIVLCFGILALAAISNFPLVSGQFRGEDEVLQLSVARTIVSQVHPWQGFESLRLVANTFSVQDQPPMRFILALPGVALFPLSELGVRLIPIILSMVMTLQVVLVGRKLGGAAVGYCSGFLVSCSGVYNWTSMAFGWSLIVCMLLWSEELLIGAKFGLGDAGERRKFRQINGCLVIAFLVNTSFVLFFGSVMLVYAWFNRRSLSKLIFSALPFGVFYFLYYIYFLFFIPWYAQHITGDPSMFGQLQHNLDRARYVYFGTAALVDNLRGLNAYVFPFFSWVLLILALFELARFHRSVLVWLAPFMLAWSFFLQVESQQYFVLCFIVLIPFAVWSCVRLLGNRTTIIAIAAALPWVMLWNYTIFIRPYPSLNGASDWLDAGWALATRRHNVVMPYAEIGRQLDRVPGSFVHDIEGCFTLFYYTDRTGDPELKHHSRLLFLPLGKSPFLPGKSVDTCLLAPEIEPQVNAVVTRKTLFSDNFALWRQLEPSGLRLYVRKGLMLREGN
jgi:hypothetical protein